MGDNFLPNVKCPYCFKPIVVAVSGFGAELNNREKFCSHCKKSFYVQILVQTTKDKFAVMDGRIRGMRESIKFLNKQRKLSYAELSIKYEMARRINEEALRIAVGMKDKAEMN